MSQNKEKGQRPQNTKKRKRVNRMKSIIVAAAILLLFVSAILNIVLIFKVFSLEQQVDKLYSNQTQTAVELQYFS